MSVDSTVDAIKSMAVCTISFVQVVENGSSDQVTAYLNCEHQQLTAQANDWDTALQMVRLKYITNHNYPKKKVS